VSRLVWCLHCERVGRCAVAGDEERCSYDDCGAYGWDLWPWGGAYEPGRVYLHYSDEQMQGIEQGRAEEDLEEDGEHAV